jgi:very-short-patch-repair endonuclease
MSRIPPQLMATMQRHHGLATYALLERHGITAQRRRTLVRDGWLALEQPGVVRLAGAPVTAISTLHAHQLSLGGLVPGSGRTAGHLLGFDGFAAPLHAHMVVERPRGARRHLAVVHRIDALPPIDVVRLDGVVAVTSGARTCIDLAADATVSDDELETAVDCACRDGWTSVAFLQRRMDKLAGPGRHGLVRLRSVVAGRPSGGVHSEVERAFVRMLHRWGLPTPTSQRVIRARNGAVIRVDFCFDTLSLIVEVSGHRTHSTRRDRQRDAQRQRELVWQGWRVAEFTSDEVFRAAPVVAGELRRVLLSPAA